MDALFPDLLLCLSPHLRLADVGRLSQTCKGMRDAVNEGHYFEQLPLVRKIRTARRDPAGNVLASVYTRYPCRCLCGPGNPLCDHKWEFRFGRMDLPCTVTKTMPMTKSDVPREMARCAVEFIRENLAAWCISVGNAETGQFDSVYARAEMLRTDSAHGTFGYRVQVDGLGQAAVIPFWRED